MAREEVLSLVKCNEYELVDNLMVVDVEPDMIDFLSTRLGFTKKIFRLLFSCSAKSVVKCFKEYDWQAVYKKDFCIRIEGNSKFSERDLAGYIWDGLKKPKVNLDKPKTAIFAFFFTDNVYCCLLEKEIKHDYVKRKAHNRPELHPSSLDPRLAKVLINLTSISKGEIVDPFCGSGGILIEAGLMGLSGVGYDIDQIMINRSKINLDYYNVKKFKLVKRDALGIKGKINYIVSDLPYGKNTKQKDLKELYSKFLLVLRKVLVERAVVVFPIFLGRNINYDSLIKKSGLKIISRFDIYIHKSMSKRIFVMEK